MSTEYVDATVYLQVAPELARWAPTDAPRSVLGAKVVNSTQSRSKKPQPGTVEVKLKIRVPKAAFLPLRPEAVVVVPEDMTAAHPIEVEAGDAND